MYVGMYGMYAGISKEILQKSHITSYRSKQLTEAHTKGAINFFSQSVQNMAALPIICCMRMEDFCT
ncbi:hypothetical protein C1H46_017552 [Malus baccata]|uniref:Uncharacterized protein n=1 Tax=Malus baccata TaxID=106549 RepID=A0A540MDJ6_MALBA|nr:hypothetical protein C1H46_017552 [Malus baccata]